MLSQIITNSQSYSFIILQFSSWYMLGLIWLIQLSTYPSFLYIPKEDFLAFHSRHTAALGFLAGPPMVVQLVSSLIWGSNNNWSILAFVALTWVFTFFVSVPIHNQLQIVGYDQKLIEKLITTNWLRTITWTGIAFYLLYLALKARGN